MHSGLSAALPWLAGASFAAWLLLSGYVALNRLAYDARHRGFGWAADALRDRTLAALPADERAAAVGDILADLSTYALDRLALDASLPAWAQEACAVRAVAGHGRDRLLARLRRGPGRFGKWTYVTALCLLVREGHPRRHDLLRLALASGDRDARQAAITLLGEIGDRQAAGILVDALAGRTLRSRIASQLDRFRTPVADLLLALAGHPEPALRALAASLLWRHAGNADVAARLEGLSGDQDPGVRKSAIQSLGEARLAQAEAIALTLLGDSVPYVRAHAIRALARVSPAGAATAIARLLGDVDWWVRQAAKESLIAIGEPATAATVAQLTSPDRFARNGAADVLQGIGAIPRLSARAREGGDAGHAAAQLLDRIVRAGERDLVGAGGRHPSWSPAATPPARGAAAA